MKRSESQSLYNALPGAYITYTCNAKDSFRYKQADKTVLKIEYWKTKEIDISDVYYPKIVSQIIPDLLNFKSDSNSNIKVDGSLNQLRNNRKQVEFLEVKNFKDENKVQIVGHINPKMFYCPKCGEIKYIEKDNDISKMKCTKEKCAYFGRRLLQYNRIWVCSCGYSSPIDSYDVNPNMYRYFADRKNGFVTSNGVSKTINSKRCPNCGCNCTMENATDPRAFYPRIITSVKLTDDQDASLCESEDGRNLIIDYQKGEMSSEEFKQRASIIKNKENISLSSISDSNDWENFWGNIIQDNGQNNVVDDSIVDEEVVYKILEYNTLKTKIANTLENSINNAIRCDRISNATEITDMLKSLKISNMFSVTNIEIIDTAYGYTRKYQSPEDVTKANEHLNLCAFKNSNVGIPAFYNIRTKTEGIMIEINKREIYNYLKNKFELSHHFNFKDLTDKELISWFMDKDKINARLVKKYQDIDEENGKMVNLYTKCVYRLLHTISHMFINTISKFCGIDKSSLSEMIFLNACSILIYSQTNQGAVLGALTQTFDKYLYELLRDTYKDNKICTFDPLCMNTSEGNCCACSYLDEVACEHFNKDLSRRLLYGYKTESVEVKNFWEEF